MAGSVAALRERRDRTFVGDEAALAYPGWRVAGAAAVGVFVSFASLLVYTFAIFLKPLSEDFGWSREAVSAAFGIAAMTVAVVSPLLGYGFDRLDPRKIILPSLVVFGGGFASLAWLTPHLWHLYAVFFALGLVGNGTAQMAYSRAVSSWFVARRGMALALVMAGGAIGSMVLPPLTGALLERVGWRHAFAILGAMVIVVGVPIVAGFVRQRADVSSTQEDQDHHGSLRDGLTSRVFWILVVVLFFSSIAQNGALTHIAALLTDRGISTETGAFAVSAMGAASLIGRLLTGWLLDRFVAARVSFVMLSLAALGTLLLAGAQSATMGIIAAMLIGVGMGGEADVTPYMLARYFGLRAFSTLYGFTYTGYAIAGGIGPVLMGKAFDATGSYTALLTQLAFGTFAVASLMLLMPSAPMLARPTAVRSRIET